jgi:hypothetical protein
VSFALEEPAELEGQETLVLQSLPGINSAGTVSGFLFSGCASWVVVCEMGVGKRRCGDVEILGRGYIEVCHPIATGSCFHGDWGSSF